MPRSNPDVGGFSAEVEIVDELGDSRTDRSVGGRGQPDQVTVVFTATAMSQPGIWSPALGGPALAPMSADGPRRWRLELSLPADANASWAAVPDVRRARFSLAQRVRAAASYRARVELGMILDGQLQVEAPQIPSLYRLIGSDPHVALSPNIALIPTPRSRQLPYENLCAPVLEPERATACGRWLTTVRDAPETPARQVVLLDGEVLIRVDEQLAETGWGRIYLHNADAVSRMREHARPLAAARGMALDCVAPACGIPLVVGTSATAPTALALALRLGADRAVLLSPAFPSDRARRALVQQAAKVGIHVDVRAGSLERGGGDPRRNTRDRSRDLAGDVERAGGSATFTEFSGGHDLAAWWPTLLDALHADRPL